MKLCNLMKCNPLAKSVRAPMIAPLTLAAIGGYLITTPSGFNQFTGTVLLGIGIFSLASRILSGLCCRQRTVAHP